MEQQPHPRSIDGLARRHGVSRATIYNEVSRGFLEITKIGARTVVTEQQESEWLERRRRTPEEQQEKASA